MRIAIDVEDVLADPNQPILDATDRLTREQIESTWFSECDEEHLYEIYMGVSDAIWRHNVQAIPPEEHDIASHVNAIHEAVDEVVILTHREHVDEQVVWWLAEHDIKYDEFISTDRPKWEFDYDVFVDDNPQMFGECRLLLRHQPWNAHINDEQSKGTDRIHSLAQVEEFL